MVGVAYSFHLTGVNFDDSYPRSNQFSPQGFGKALHCCLSGTINATPDVWLPSSDTANIDDIARTTICPLLENWKNSLCHVDQTRDIRSEHDVDVFFGNLGSFGYTLNQTTVVFSTVLWTVRSKYVNVRVVD